MSHLNHLLGLFTGLDETIESLDKLREKLVAVKAEFKADSQEHWEFNKMFLETSAVMFMLKDMRKDMRIKISEEEKK